MPSLEYRCPECGQQTLTKAGVKPGRVRKQRYQCTNPECGRLTVNPEPARAFVRKAQKRQQSTETD